MCSNPHLVQMSQVVYGFLIAVGSIPPKIRTMCHIATGCVRKNTSRHPDIQLDVGPPPQKIPACQLSKKNPNLP